MRDHGDAAWTTGGAADLIGPGADPVTLTIQDDQSPPQPAADADVWISVDASGSNVIAGTVQSNSNGQVTFMLDDGATYYLWMQKDGLNPIKGKQFVAVKDA
ncbi:MAG: hypothetical protein O7G85_06595 [Planctomycetota bacterium]|nr:hypothetical protein [Planctomycetota bacterium]